MKTRTKLLSLALALILVLALAACGAATKTVADESGTASGNSTAEVPEPEYASDQSTEGTLKLCPRPTRSSIPAV